MDVSKGQVMMDIQFPRRAAIGLAAAASVAMARPARAATPVTVRIGVQPVESAGQAFYGKDLGWFDQAGLDVQITPLSNGGALVAAVIAGSLDIGLSAVGPIAQALISVPLPRTGRKKKLRRLRDAAPLAGSPWPRASPTPWACSPRPPDLLRSSSLRGGQLEDKRDAGTARAGECLHLVRDPPHDPQAVTGQFRKRIQQGRGIRGCDQVAIVDLAMQCPRQLPYSQSSLPAAMADHIGRQLVNGQGHIPGPVIRQSRLTGKSQHFGSQDIQRA